MGLFDSRKDKTSQLQKDAWAVHMAELLSRGCLDEIITHCDKAIETDPGDSNAWFWKATSLDEMNRPDEAITSIDKAINFAPKVAIYWSKKGSILSGRLNHLEEAFQCIIKALQLSKDDETTALILYGASNCYFKAGQLDDALKSIERAIKLNPPEEYLNSFKSFRQVLKDMTGQ